MPYFVQHNASVQRPKGPLQTWNAPDNFGTDIWHSQYLSHSPISSTPLQMMSKVLFHNLFFVIEWFGGFSEVIYGKLAQNESKVLVKDYQADNYLEYDYW